MNFAYYLREFSNPPKSICLDLYSFTVLIHNWLLMIDIGLLFFRNVTTFSDNIISETKLRIMAQYLYIGLQVREITRISVTGNTAHHYDTPGAAISPEVTRISVPFFGTHYSRADLWGVQGIRTPYFLGVDPPPFFSIGPSTPLCLLVYTKTVQHILYD